MSASYNQEVKNILARYQNLEISGPAAARELGLTYFQFVQLLAEHGIPTNYPTAEDLEHDVAAIKQLRRKRS